MNTDKYHELEPAWLECVRNEVAKLRYGTVQIVVSKGQVMQLETTEKVRMSQIASLPSPTHPGNQ